MEVSLFPSSASNAPIVPIVPPAQRPRRRRVQEPLDLVKICQQQMAATDDPRRMESLHAIAHHLLRARQQGAAK